MNVLQKTGRWSIMMATESWGINLRDKTLIYVRKALGLIFSATQERVTLGEGQKQQASCRRDRSRKYHIWQSLYSNLWNLSHSAIYVIIFLFIKLNSKCIFRELNVIATSLCSLSLDGCDIIFIAFSNYIAVWEKDWTILNW